MTSSWEHGFRHRLMAFGASQRPADGGVPVSIKIRVTSGCFHREHSPRAYSQIDAHLSALRPDERTFAFEEHESGPEVLVYLALTIAGITLGASIINLVVAILKARSEGVKAGDHPSDPLELIVRTVRTQEQYVEEVVLRVGPRDALDPGEIEKRIAQAVQKLLGDRERVSGRAPR
jgi:hypothetical protein